MTKARGQRTSPFPSFLRRRETRYTGSQEEAKEAGGFGVRCVSGGSFLPRRIQLFIAYLYKPEAQAKVFKYLFIIQTLFLRLRFRLVRQEIPLRVVFHIRRSLWTKERSPFDKLRDRGSVRSVSLPNWPVSSRKGKISFNISLGAKSKSCKWRSCSGASPSQLLCL